MKNGKRQQKIYKNFIFGLLKNIFMMRERIVLGLLIMLMSLPGYGQIVNIESKRIITDTTGWSGGFGLNSAFIKNQKELFSFGSKTHVQWKPTLKSLFLLVGEYGLTKGGQNVFQDYGFGHFRYTKRFNRRFAFESFAQAQYNKVNRLRYRGLLGAGPRYELVSSNVLKMFVATLFMIERDVSIDGAFFEGGRLSAYLSFTYSPSKFFQLVNTTYYQPRINLLSDYRISGETKFMWKIHKNLKFVTSYYYSYDEFPAEGAPKQNLRLNNGLKFTF